MARPGAYSSLRQKLSGSHPFPGRQSDGLLGESFACWLKSSEVKALTEPARHNESRKIELKRELTKLQSYATIIGILVGSGIFVVTGKSGTIAGPSVPLAYLVLAPVVVATAVVYSVYLSTTLGTRPGGEYLQIACTTGSYYLVFVAVWLE